MPPPTMTTCREAIQVNSETNERWMLVGWQLPTSYESGIGTNQFEQDHH